jgi:electron transport complex protein RnfG
MRETIRYGFILGIICAVASGLLATVNSFTRPRIIAQAQAQEDAAFKELLPAASRFEPVCSGGETLYYKGYGSDGSFVGVVFKAAGKGYSSTIETMAGMDRDSKITAIKVVSLNETPGLGSRVAEGDFIRQFAGQDVSTLDQVQAITGATISSRAVIQSVTAKARQIAQQIKHEQ